MRKTFSAVLLSIVITTTSSIYAVHAEPLVPSQETQEKLTQDTLLTTLSPHIQEAIANYYGYPKQFALFWTKILDIKRKSEGEYTFTVKLQARTFEHAHSSPIGIETITMDVSPFGVKIINFEHKGDEWEQKIEQFNKELLNDIIKTFNLDLTYFKKYEYRQLEYLAEQGNGNFVSIHNIIEEIVKELNKDIKPPYKNFINPFTFVKDDKAYILFKKADGTNFVYTFKKNDNTWIVIKKESKQGKKMPKELLWYMYKHLIYIMLGSITMR